MPSRWGGAATNLVSDDEEQAVDQNAPDEDVAKDAGHQAGGVRHHDGAVPVHGNKGPGQRTRDDGLVDEARVADVAKVQRRQVDPVEDDHDLGPGEVASHKQHDEGKVEEVVHDEMAPHGAGRVQLLEVGREEVRNVAALQDEQEKPARPVSKGAPPPPGVSASGALTSRCWP